MKLEVSEEIEEMMKAEGISTLEGLIQYVRGRAVREYLDQVALNFENGIWGLGRNNRYGISNLIKIEQLPPGALPVYSKNMGEGEWEVTGMNYSGEDVVCEEMDVEFEDLSSLKKGGEDV